MEEQILNTEEQIQNNEEQVQNNEEQVKKFSLLKWCKYFILGFIAFSFIYSFAQVPMIVPISNWIKLPLYAVGAVILYFSYVWFERKYQRANPLSLDKEVISLQKNACSWTGKGLLVGLGYFAVLTLIMVSAGCYQVESVQFDLSDFFASLALFLVVATGEEIIFRGILFRLIDDRWNLWAALIVSGLIFGFVHAINPGATLWSSIAISIEAGLLLGMAYKWSGNLWFPIGIHWAWNYTQGPILGCAVSGTTFTSSIITPTITGSTLITGGEFGPEASLPALIAGIAITGYLLYDLKKRTELNFRKLS